MCWLHKIAMLLLVVGGLNWGLVAWDPSYNLISMIFGDPTMTMMASRVVYALVGLSALVIVFGSKCCAGGAMCMGSKCQGSACQGMKQ